MLGKMNSNSESSLTLARGILGKTHDSVLLRQFVNWFIYVTASSVVTVFINRAVSCMGELCLGASPCWPGGGFSAVTDKRHPDRFLLMQRLFWVI